MAESIQVSGVVAAYVGTGSSGALQLLGYTRNGADTTKEAFWLDVPGDQNGGDEGPPIDIQFLGEIVRVRLELTKWDTSVASSVAKRSKNTSVTAGTPMPAGSLMFAGDHAMRLLLYTGATGTNPRNFVRAFPRQQIELNRGTKFSTFVCEFECHKNAAGLLYNADVTGLPA